MSLGPAFDGVLTAARVGAEWAWERLLAEYGPAVLAYLRSQGAADPDALFGDVLLGVVQGIDRFEGSEGQFRSWWFTIAHHRVVDERRRRRRRPTVPDEGIDRPDASAGVEEEVVAAFSSAEVTELLGVLKADQRDVVLLRVVAGLSVDEVAEALGKKPGTVRVLQHRALERLRRVLEARNPAGDENRGSSHPL